MTPIRVRDHLDRRDMVAMAVLLLVGIGAPVWLAVAAGALGLPTSDDWVYSQGALSLFRTGHIEMPGHTAASIGQLILVQPLLWLSGGDPLAFSAFGLTMVSIAIVSTYLLARRFIGLGSAVLVVLLVLIFPGLSRESTSFMTDIPSFALMMLCLLLGTLWLDGGGGRLILVAALTAGLLAFSIREFAIAAPAAVLALSWARSRVEDRVWLAGASGAFLFGLVGVVLAASSIAGRQFSEPHLFGLLIVGPMFVTLAAILLPALVLGLGRRMSTIGSMSIVLGAAIASLMAAVPWGWATGNLWMENGFAGDLLLSGTRGGVIDFAFWTFSRQVATFAAVLLGASVVVWVRRNLTPANSLGGVRANASRVIQSRDGLVAFFLLAYSVEIVVFSPFWIYDRYLVPLVPVAAILLLRGRPQSSSFGRSLALSHAALAWLAVSAFVITANSFAYDGARWRAGEAAVSMGYDARMVDAGYEWVGYHGSGVAKPGLPADNMEYNGSRWSLRDSCAVVSNSPIYDDGLTLVRVDQEAYLNALFFGGPEPLYLYGNARPSCPRPPAAWTAVRRH